MTGLFKSGRHSWKKNSKKTSERDEAIEELEKLNKLNHELLDRQLEITEQYLKSLSKES